MKREHLPKRIKNNLDRQFEIGLMPLEEVEERLLKLAWEKYGDTEEIAKVLKISRTTQRNYHYYSDLGENCDLRVSTVIKMEVNSPNTNNIVFDVTLHNC